MNTRRHFLKQVITSSLLFQLGCSVKPETILRAPTNPVTGTPTPTPEPTLTPSPTPNPRPGANNNVLFIAIDDLNDWLGCYYKGDIFPGVRPFTPNLDRFANRDAMLFENAHTPIALCNPARHAIFYGAEPFLSGIMNNTGNQHSQFHHSANCFFDHRTSLNAFFKQRNYETIGVGKLYHGAQEKVTDGTFDLYYNVKAGERAKCIIASNADLPKRLPYAKVDNGTARTGCPAGIIHIDAVTRNWACRQLDRLAARGNAGRPFFLGVGFARPHAPYYAPTWCWNKYSQTAIRAYVDSMFPGEADLIPSQIRDLFQDRLDNQNDLFTRGELSQYLHGYLAAITYLDFEIGKLFDKLRSLPLWKNTTVVLWSDHGYHFGEKQLQAKNTLWERATKIPLLVRVPGLNEGTRSKSLVTSFGFYNTLTEMTLGEKNPQVHGESFYAVLKDPKAEVMDHVLSAVSLDGDTENIGSIKSVGYTVREKDWRYLLYRRQMPDGSFQLTEELYYLAADPKERNNLVENGRGAYGEICDRLQSKVPVAFGQRAPLPRLNCE